MFSLKFSTLLSLFTLDNLRQIFVFQFLFFLLLLCCIHTFVLMQAIKKHSPKDASANFYDMPGMLYDI